MSGGISLLGDQDRVLLCLVLKLGCLQPVWVPVTSLGACDQYVCLEEYQLPVELDTKICLSFISCSSSVQHWESLGLFGLIVHGTACLPIYNSEAICYMYDILVYSCTLSDHWQIVCQVLSTLWKWRLFLKPEKCKFEQKEVEYLRLVILKDHVAMDLTKVCGVTEWPTPMKVKEVQSFLGFVNFYWKFICDFSNIV